MKLKDIIEKGVCNLEKIADVKWPKSNCSYLTRDKFIIAIEKAIINDITPNIAAGYKKDDGFARAMRNIATNIQNKPTHIFWKNYILKLAGFKMCPKCKKIKCLDAFYINNSECIVCSKICKEEYYEKNRDKILKQKKVYYKENKEEIVKKKKIYYDENKEQINKKVRKHRKENNDEVIKKDKEYYEKNKKIKNEQKVNRKKKTVLHIIDVIIREGKLPECSMCGYKENWAALDFHHIDSELKRPNYSYNQKTGEKYSPSQYIFGCSPKTAEVRYLTEINNLELLCCNCHQKEHTKINSPNNIKSALDIKYKCEVCDESANLHLHHNTPSEKEYTFSDFDGQSKERILQDGLLEKEMKKDVSILCGNHHREYHNANWKLPITNED